MKVLVLMRVYWVTHAAAASGQVLQVTPTSRTVATTKHSSLDHELLRFLVFTHEADGPTDGPALFKVPLLVTTPPAGIGVYKFGLDGAHAGYHVVFQYRDHLVLSSARVLGPLTAQLHHFLTRYPTAFSAAAQRSVQRQFQTIVEYNQTAGETELYYSPKTGQFSGAC